MVRYLSVITIIVATAACTHPSSATNGAAGTGPELARVTSAAAPPDAALRAAPAASLPLIDFAAHGLAASGCFFVRDVTSGSEQVSNAQRCAQGRRPNSTFKIVNALIGADLGLLSSPDAIMKWDAVRYPKQEGWLDGWAQDQTLRDAMRISAVPLFRKLAHDIGPARMAEYLARLDYGNRDLSGENDSFWLEGGLRITALQQVQLITGLVRNELPVSKRAHTIVREVLQKDPIAGARHAGKTGSGSLETHHTGWGEGPMVGWMVGWIELERGPVAYAMWVEGPSFDAMREQRAQIVDRVLSDVVKSWQ